ncbi:MAG: hypothetical protein QXT45_04250 [Candidatus Bilamarchaeaceae archaeon]
MGTTWSEVPGVGYWRWFKPYARNLFSEQMALWKGAIQPWETAQYRNLEQSARRAAELMRENMMNAGLALNLDPGVMSRMAQQGAESVVGKLPAVAQAIRSMSDPWGKLVQQQELAQRLIGLGLQLKQLQTAQDQANEAASQGILGGVLGGVGSILGNVIPFGLGRLFPSPFQQLLTQLLGSSGATGLASGAAGIPAGLEWLAMAGAMY